MWIEHDITALRLQRPSAVTIGAFDGVHRGHQTLIQAMIADARARGVGPLIVTFDPLPGQVRDPHRSDLLSTLPERLEWFQDLGIGGVIVVPFDTAFMQTTATHFVATMVSKLALRALWIGPDFRLGKNREGDVGFLQNAGARLGFEVQ